MNRSEFSLYISSPFNGGLFRLDTATGRVDVLQEYHGTGLCLYGGMLYQVVEGNSVYLLDHNGKIKQGYYLGENYYHDLFVWEIGFGVVNTRNSWIEWYDTSFTLVQQSPELVVGASQVEDGCHLNSARIRHRQVYGCCFILSDQSKAYRRGNDEHGVVFRQDDKVSVIADHFHRPHSIRPAGRVFTLCDSGRSDVVVCDYNGHEIRRMKIMTKEGNIGFARGLLKVPGGWMVGLSSPRHGNKIENWVMCAHVVHIDEVGNVLNSWKLPCHEVYDIVMMS